MHLVRSTNGVTFIDEQHLVRPSNLTFVSSHGFYVCSLYRVYALASAIVELFEHTSDVLRVERTRRKT
jgi:hypothetical protein